MFEEFCVACNCCCCCDIFCVSFSDESSDGSRNGFVDVPDDVTAGVDVVMVAVLVVTSLEGENLTVSSRDTTFCSFLVDDDADDDDEGGGGRIFVTGVCCA